MPVLLMNFYGKQSFLKDFIKKMACAKHKPFLKISCKQLTFGI